MKICCGAFLSGPEVIEDNKQCIALRNRFPEALAVEMEGEGKSVTFFSIFLLAGLMIVSASINNLPFISFHPIGLVT